MLKPQAINNLVEGAEFGYNADTDTITWLNTDIPQPSDSVINTEVSRLEAIATYQEPRSRAYPSLTDQADMQYWDSVNGTTTWADAITAVKEAHPKP